MSNHFRDLLGGAQAASQAMRASLTRGESSPNQIHVLWHLAKVFEGARSSVQLFAFFEELQEDFFFSLGQHTTDWDTLIKKADLYVRSRLYQLLVDTNPVAQEQYHALLREDEALLVSSLEHDCRASFALRKTQISQEAIEEGYRLLRLIYRTWHEVIDSLFVAGRSGQNETEPSDMPRVSFGDQDSPSPVTAALLSQCVAALSSAKEEYDARVSRDAAISGREGKGDEGAGR